MTGKETYVNEFLVREFDYRGRSLPIYFRIPPILVHDVYALLESGRLPFQTREEVSRCAFCIGIRSLAEVKEFDYSSPLIRLPVVLYRRPDFISPEEFVREVGRIVQDLSALGYRTPALRKFISVVEDLVGCLPSSYDRERFLNVMEECWPSVVASTIWPDHPSTKGYRAR